jgi:Tol biopolymer transport system component
VEGGGPASGGAAASGAGAGGSGGAAGAGEGGAQGPGGGPVGDPCAIQSIEKLGPRNVYVSPDGKKFVENKRDESGVYQVHVGDFDGSFGTLTSTCTTCTQVPGGPAPDAQKMMVVWHPSSEWLFVGAEFEHALPPWISPEQDVGLMQCGLSLDMYAMKLDGSAWYPLTHHDPAAGGGYTGPAVTPDGKRAYWAEIVDGNIFAYTFGKWRLMQADVVYDAQGVPSFTNTIDISPPDTNWIEPGNVSPDGKYLALTLDTGLAPDKAAGMDQWLLELETGAYTNLNGTPSEWDEHGIFAPNSKKVVFMSSHPYPAYDATTAPFGIFGFISEFMMMDIDGSNLVQLTHYNEPGYPDSTPDQTSVAAVAFFTPDGSQLVAAQLLTGAGFPNQETWLITFAGRCGGDGGF